MPTQLSSRPLFVGTYAKGGGEGIYPLHVENGKWALGQPDHRARNASFGAFSRRHRIHYLLDERSQGSIGVFRWEDARWQPFARVPTGGAEPCYAALNADESWLAVTNYGSGSLALFRPDAEAGCLGEPVAVRQDRGHGPDPERQDGPHAHCAVLAPEGNWLYQTDLGTDEVLAHRIEETGLGERHVAYRTPAGSGPRHIVCHPREPLAILLTELASTLTTLKVNEGTLAEQQTISTLPAGFEGESLGGHLGINAAGDRIYVTNRGHDSIAVFALADGALRLLGHTPAGGKSPRFFLLLDYDRTMLVANEQGNSVTVFDVQTDGTLSQCGEVAVPAPAFIFAAG